MGEDILTTDNLKVYFSRKKRVVKALDGVNIFLREGLATSLAGESGCGKSTLAKTILGFHRPREGGVYYRGKEISLRRNEALIRRNIQIVFQNPSLSLDPRFTVFSVLFEALRVFRKIKKREARDAIIAMLKEVELGEEVISRYPDRLSGGEQQRVCIARALINRPPLIILDEPTSSLDLTTALKIIELLIKLEEHFGLTFLVISHNLKLLKRISRFCFIMYYGRIVEYGPKDEIYGNPLHPYTKTLLAASAYKLRRFEEKPLPLKGCLFFPHCPFRKERCAEGCLHKEVGRGHFVFCNLF